MTNEIVKTETGTTELVAPTENLLKELGIEAKDLAIYKILLMQKTSELVGDEKAAFGDLVHSSTGEKFGGFESPVEVIPVKMYKSWVVYDMSEGTPKFVRTEPMNDTNSNLPWEFVDQAGVQHRRDQSINVMALLSKEIAETGEAFPFILSFRRTSFQAGKDIATQITRSRMFSKPMYARTVMLGVDKRKVETNTFALFTAKPGRPTNEAEAKAALMWMGILKTQDVKVDDSDLAKESAATSATPTVSPSVQVLGGESDKKNDLY